MSWYSGLRGKVRLNVPLKEHTTFKLGGRAKYFVEPQDIEDLKLLLVRAKRYRLQPFVIGAGSNILVDDRGIKGIVLRLNEPHFKKIMVRKNRFEAGCGCLLDKVIQAARHHGLSGLEALAGIPGTLGGAIMMNAGQAKAGACIGDVIQTVRVMDYNGNIKILNRNDIPFGYRMSGLSKYVILSACLKLNMKNKARIRDKINEYLRYRRITQDLSKPSAGCVFKNPSGNSAGRLIDMCGLKGKRIGDACVSLRHANFLLNLRNAKATDVLKLMKLIQAKVKERFGITLEPEIKIWH